MDFVVSVENLPVAADVDRRGVGPLAIGSEMGRICAKEQGDVEVFGDARHRRRPLFNQFQQPLMKLRIGLEHRRPRRFRDHT